jgi:hypothetical protein
MTDFLIAFVMTSLAGAAIGPLSTAVASWCNKHFPPLAYSYGSDPAEPYPKMPLLRIAVCCVFFVWGSFIAIMFVIVLASIGLISDARSLLIAFIAIFLSTWALYITIAFMIRCPKCMRHLLIQWTARPQHAEKTKLGAEVWAAIVLKAAMNKDFQCLECGQWFSLKPKDSRSTANA